MQPGEKEKILLHTASDRPMINNTPGRHSLGSENTSDVGKRQRQSQREWVPLRCHYIATRCRQYWQCLIERGSLAVGHGPIDTP